MYFINTYIFRPAIMTASMAGDGLQDLIAIDLHTPTGLTIDYNMNGRLFWTDPYQDIIESCAFDGSDRTTIISPTLG
jgi:hypothetical protein